MKNKFKGFYTPKANTGNISCNYNYGAIYRVEDVGKGYSLESDHDSIYISKYELNKLYKKASSKSIKEKIDYYKEKLALYEI